MPFADAGSSAAAKPEARPSTIALPKLTGMSVSAGATVALHAGSLGRQLCFDLQPPTMARVLAAPWK